MTSTSNNDHHVDQNSITRQGQSFSPRTPSTTEVFKHIPVATPDDEQDSNQGGIISELNRWESVRQEDVFFSGGEGDDSDDDLL